jgi:hypothetical protein
MPLRAHGDNQSFGEIFRTVWASLWWRGAIAAVVALVFRPAVALGIAIGTPIAIVILTAIIRLPIFHRKSVARGKSSGPDRDQKGAHARP